MRKVTGRLAAIALTLAVLGAVLAMRAGDPTLLSALRGAGFDTLQRIWPREMAEPQPVRIVDIDEASLAELGQWPWPRSTLADMTAALFELGAAGVAFDIVFPEPDRLSPRRMLEQHDAAAALASAAPGFDTARLPDNDANFAAALAGNPAVLAVASSSAKSEAELPQKSGFAQTGANAIGALPRLSAITSNIPPLQQAAAGLGVINIDLAGEQGVARQIPMLWSLSDRFVPALVPEVLRVAQGVDTFLVHGAPDTENAIEALGIGDIEVPLAESGGFYLYYRHNDPALYVSASKLLSPDSREALRPLIEGHIVFVGTSAVGLLDIRTTALGEAVPGVSIHAQATEQILSGVTLSRPEWVVGAEFIFVAAAGLLLAVFGAFIKPWKTLVVFLGLSAAVLAAVALSFRQGGLLLDATFPLLASGLTFLTAIALRLLVTDRESRKLRGAFGQYVAPAVLAEIEANPQALKLGGEMRDVTVMFVDIENFTPLGEKLPPEQLVKVVNRLLDACSKAILAEKGTIDKYIGDAVMAFWNAPVRLKAHQYHAAKAALGVRAAIAALNEDKEMAETLATYGCPRLAVRVGIASGPACVGNMGSEERFDYSVLGETVNIASRAEGSCKAIGHDIVVAGEVAPETAKLALLPAGHVAMKGKSKPQSLTAILGDEQHAALETHGKLQRQVDGVIAALLKAKPGKRSLALQGLLDEVADQHPSLKKFITALPGRLDDFRTS